jgi:hypothetical protein
VSIAAPGAAGRWALIPYPNCGASNGEDALDIILLRGHERARTAVRMPINR